MNSYMNLEVFIETTSPLIPLTKHFQTYAKNINATRLCMDNQRSLMNLSTRLTAIVINYIFN